MTHGSTLLAVRKRGLPLVRPLTGTNRPGILLSRLGKGSAARLWNRYCPPLRLRTLSAASSALLSAAIWGNDRISVIAGMIL